MKSRIILAVLAIMTSGAPVTFSAQHAEAHAMIVHDLYVKLKDNSPAAIDKQIELGKKYLANHPGEVSFTPAVLATGLTRHKQVAVLENDFNFDVAFHLVFANAAAHNAYQTSDRHVKGFISESKLNWVKIRVFDSSTK